MTPSHPATLVVHSPRCPLGDREEAGGPISIHSTFGFGRSSGPPGVVRSPSPDWSRISPESLDVDSTCVKTRPVPSTATQAPNSWTRPTATTLSRSDSSWRSPSPSTSQRRPLFFIYNFLLAILRPFYIWKETDFPLVAFRISNSLTSSHWRTSCHSQQSSKQ